MATAGRQEYTAQNRASDGVRCIFQWDAEYDDVARTVTVTASDSPAGCSLRAVLRAILSNNQVQSIDLLTAGPGGTSIINQGPTVVANNVRLKLGTQKGVQIVDITQDWDINST